MTDTVLPPYQTLTCDGRYYSSRMGVHHYCGLPPGHEGKHRCQLCGGEWE